MRVYLVAFLMISVFIAINIGIASAIVVQNYERTTTNEIKQGSLEISFDDAPAEEENIIHFVNVTTWYRPTQYYSNLGCTQNGTTANITLYSRSDSATMWRYLRSTKTFNYDPFIGDITEKINKNEYDFKYEISTDDSHESEDDFCIYVKNITLDINYTVKGAIEIAHNYTDTIRIGKGQTYNLKIFLKCTPKEPGTISYEYFCGQMKYEVRSQNGLIGADSLWSNKNLGYDADDTSEEVSIPIYANSTGYDYLFVDATGYYKSENLSNMFAESPAINIEVTNGSGSSQSAGSLSVNEPVIYPPNPVPKGDDVQFKVTVFCNNGYCGNVSGHVATRMDIKERPSSCILDKGESCDFIWVLGYNDTRSPPYSVYAIFSSDEPGVADKDVDYSIDYSTLKTAESQNIVNVEFEHPKKTSFYVGEDFELSAVVTCEKPTTGSVDCGGTKIYALFDDYGSLTYIDNSSKIYMTDYYQSNPVDYSINTLKKWNLRSDTPGTYRLGIESINSDQGINKEMMPFVITINERLSNDTNSTAFDNSSYSMEIMEPSSSKIYKRGDEVYIKIKALKNDSICTDCTVYASSSLMKESFNLGFENGFYTGTGTIRDDAGKVGNIDILLNNKKSVPVKIIVDPVISITAQTDKETYDIYDVIKISGVSPKRAYVNAELVCNNYKKNIDAKQADSAGKFEFEIPISLAVPGGECYINVNAKDLHSNIGSQRIDIMIRNSEMKTYNLIFVSPQKDSSIMKGDVVNITLQVARSNQGIDGMKVYCNGLSHDTINLTNTADGIYKSSYKVPIHSEKGEWVLSCITKKGNEFGSNSMILHLISPKINIEVIEPNPYKPIPSGKTLKIKVKALYNDGAPVNNARITMKVNGGSDVILRQSVNGTYVGNFDTGENSFVSIDFSASDGKGVTGNIDKLRFDAKTAKFSDYLMYMVVAIVIIIVALISIVIAGKRGGNAQTTIITKTEKIDMAEVEEKVKEKHKMDRKLGLKEKLSDLQMEYENIDNDIDMIHKEYYRREIDEDTFVKLLQERKERKQNIISMMNNITRELKSIQNQNEKRGNG